MRIVELKGRNAKLEALLAAAQDEDLVISKGGHVLARIEKFTDDDLQDWLFEHDPKVIRDAQKAVRSIRKGKGISLKELQRELGV